MSREKRAARELTESEIVGTVDELRSQAPGIGAYKSSFLILKGVYGGRMRGRDAFYRLMHERADAQALPQASYDKLQPPVA